MENSELSVLPKVVLLNEPDLTIAEIAIRKSHDNMNKSDMVIISPHGKRVIGSKGLDLIKRVGTKLKHESVLEHIVFSFDIYNISRAVLQELARHRIASYTVKSSRYTLKELKNEEEFTNSHTSLVRAKKYVKLTNDYKTDKATIIALENLRLLIQDGISNDICKYAMPEAYLTSLVMTINARSLRNFITLRTSRSALKEISDLAMAMYNTLPENIKELFSDCIPSLDSEE